MRAHPISPAALALLAACSGGALQDPAEERRIGILRLYETVAPNALAAPDTVQAGVDFPVTVKTLGGGCERAGDTQAEVSGSVAAVTPYDYTDLTANACPDLLRTFPHTATLRFAAPGEAVIRARGRRVGPDTPAEGVPTTLEKRVVVR